MPMPFQRSLLPRVGALLATVVLLAILSMLISVFIAQTTAGLAAAVNQSGSLRMQSYRIGMTLTDLSVPPARRLEQVKHLAEELEQRLTSRRLVDVIPAQVSQEIRAGYERIVQEWREHLRPALHEDLRRLPESEHRQPLAPAYLEHVDDFVTRIDRLVGQLEDVTEGRIAMLRLVHLVALILTLAMVLFTLILVQRRVVRPLGALLECADRARRGDFAGRTRFTGGDELGRLGEAMNRMAEDLSRLYEDLEWRVAEKTRDLQRTNHSLELLYALGQTLHESAISAPMLKRVLLQIRDQLGLHAVTLCLQEDPRTHQGRTQVTTRGDQEQRAACSRPGCLACGKAEPARPFALPIRTGGERPLVAFPVTDRDRHFGVLIVDLTAGQELPAWQEPLLASLAALLGSALGRHQRQGDARRLSLYEERGIIARELHDSLAQSLSYLKIQAARLDALVSPATDRLGARLVLAELRDGISTAYRDLRELLSTFRLKMDERGLNAALESTVAEFGERGATEIRLDNRLPPLLLSPHEEIHVLQIVREALSNVVRHAAAKRATLRLTMTQAGIRVTLEDDGRGIDTGALPPGHYGLQIMRERAASLGGTIEIGARSRGGTRVCLTFTQREIRETMTGQALAGATS